MKLIGLAPKKLIYNYRKNIDIYAKIIRISCASKASKGG